MAMAVKTDPQFLTQLQRLTISTFTDEKSLLADTARSLKYIQENPSVQIRLGREILAGAAVGGAGGGVVGLCSLIFRAIPLPPSPVSFVAKMIIYGASLGGALGVLSGAKIYVFEIKQSDEYLKWRAEAIRDRVLFRMFEDFIQREDVARGFLCPITHDLIRIPVRVKSQKECDGNGVAIVYEQQRITEWVVQKTKTLAYRYLQMTEDQFNTEASSPERRKAILRRVIDAIPDEERVGGDPAVEVEGEWVEVAEGGRVTREQVLKGFSLRNSCFISEDDLEYDPTYHQRLFQRLREVFNREIDHRVYEGLLKYVSDVRQTKEQIAQHLLAEDSARLAAGRVSEKAHLEKVREIQTLLALKPI